MKKVINFRITLWRQRLSIYGWSNILVFCLIFSIIVAGSKFLLSISDNYVPMIVLLSAFVYCFCSGIIFANEDKISKEKQLILIYFNKVDPNKYEKYLTYSRYVYFQIIYLYLAFPTDITDFFTFSCAFFVLQLGIMLLTIVRHYTSTTFFNSYQAVSSFLTCIMIFMANRIKFELPIELKNNDIAFLLWCISILFILVTVKNLSKINQRKKTIHFFNATNRIFKKCNNKDLIYAYRYNCLSLPIFVIILSTLASFIAKETFADLLLTHMLSFSYALTDVYFKLLKYENGAHTICYSASKYNDFKCEKIKNTIFILLPYLIILSIPVSIITSFSSVYIALIISCILFVINAILNKLYFEKKNGYEKVVTDKDELIFIVVYSLQIILISIFVYLTF